MVRLGLVADVHMRRTHVDALVEELEWVAGHFEADFDADHVFVLGDLVEHGSFGGADVSGVRAVADVFGGRSYPTTYLLGNHDVETISRETLSDALGQDGFEGVVEVGGTTVLTLDSSWPEQAGAPGLLGADQVERAGDRLREADRALLFVHHPVGPFDLSRNPWFGDHPERAFLVDRKELLDEIADAGGVAATVSGHLHQTELATTEVASHVSLSAFSKEAPGTPVTGTYAELVVGDGLDLTVAVRGDAVASYSL